MKSFTKEMGLSWSSRDNGFFWGWGHGSLMWAPYWFKKAIVHTVNPLMCKIYGHKIIGPIEDDGSIVVEKCCYMCSSKKV